MKSFYQNPHVYIPLLLACILMGISFFVGYTQLGASHDRIVLHQNIMGEIDQTGYRSEVLIGLGVVCIFLCMNSILARIAYSRERFLSYFFTYISVWIATLGLIYIASVVGLN